MRVLRTRKICGVAYEVCEISSKDVRPRGMTRQDEGYCDSFNCRIYVVEAPAARQKELQRHEVCHAIYYESAAKYHAQKSPSDDTEETLVRCLTIALATSEIGDLL